MATSTLAIILVALLAGSARAAIDNPAATCSGKAPNSSYYLEANVSTVAWGYFWDQRAPWLTVVSGDTVDVEMITHHAGDDYDKLIKGDPKVEGIYEWTKDGPAISTRGATGAADGVHILTGPIYVCDAEPGDVLQVDILDLKPRKNPSTGKTYGVNAAAWWGYQFRAGFKDNKLREVTTIYEIITDSNGNPLYAVPDYMFTYGNTTKYMGPVSPTCVATNGTFPGLLPNTSAAASTWANPKRGYPPGVTVPCVNGTQKWESYWYPGLITQHPTGTEDYTIRGKFKVPINFHIGNIGIVPKYDSAVTSIPPLPTGGNMDSRRVGKGASLYFPVQVPGALLTMGDAHTAQGNSEFDGTGIETSVNGKFKITLHKKATLPSKVKELSFVLLENANEYVIHGYAYNDYLNELPDPQNTIFSEGANLDKAFTGAYRNARDWLMSFKGLTEDQAITLLTVACDFEIAQVVDGNFGAMVTIPKYAFDNDKAPFKPKTVTGSSEPVK